MSEPISKLNDLRQELRMAYRVVAGLIFMGVLLAAGFIMMPRQFTVHYPPDLSRSMTMRLGEVPPSTVYAFAALFMEHLNYCKTDCSSEYLNNINTNRSFLTDRCYTELSNHFKHNEGLYKGRTRRLMPTAESIYAIDKVRQVSANSWVVTDVWMLEERVRAQELRTNHIRYPIRVERAYLPQHLNPYQLQLDCFDGEPERVAELTPKNS